MWLKIVRDLLLHGTTDGADLERVSWRTWRLCLLITSALLLSVIVCLFLAAFLPGTEAFCEEWASCFWGWGFCSAM